MSTKNLERVQRRAMTILAELENKKSLHARKDKL